MIIEDRYSDDDPHTGMPLGPLLLCPLVALAASSSFSKFSFSLVLSVRDPGNKFVRRHWSPFFLFFLSSFVVVFGLTLTGFYSTAARHVVTRWIGPGSGKSMCAVCVFVPFLIRMGNF